MTWIRQTKSRRPKMSATIPKPTSPNDSATSDSITNQSHSVQKYLNDYLLAVNKTGCSSATVRNYRSDINQFLEFLGNFTLNDLRNKPKLLAFAHYQRDKGLKENSVKRKLVSITQFKNWLKEQGLIKSEIPLAVINSSATTTTKDELERKIIDGRENQETETNKTLQPEEKGQKKGDKPRNDKPRSRLLILLNVLALLLFLGGLAYFAYQQFGQAVISMAYPSAPVAPSRVLSYQGRLTNTAQSPISTATNMSYALYDADTGGSLLWSSNTCTIDPDQDGIFNANLGAGAGTGADNENCGGTIGDEVFTENANVWLAVTIGAETLTPRQPIRTVAYALNSSTLQGLPPAEVATNSTILMMNSTGEVVLGTDNPVIRAATTSSGMTIEANQIFIQNRAGSNGDLVLTPDGTGIVDMRGDASVSGQITIVGNTNLTSPNSLIFGGTTALGEISAADDAGAYLIGAYDEFDNSNSANVQGVLNDLDTAIAVGGSGTMWTLNSGVVYPTNSASDLVVGGTTLVASMFGLDESAGNFYFGADNSADPTLNFEATDGDAGEFGFNTNDAFYFNNANVGIGLTNPDEKLTVNGSVNAEKYYDYTNKNYYLDPAAVSIGLNIAGSSIIGGELVVGATADGGLLTYDTLNNVFNIGTDSTINGDLAFFTDDLFLDKSSGFVGIGTTNPGYKLEVSGGDVQFDGNAYFANGTTYYVDSSGNAKFLDLSVADSASISGVLTVGDGTTNTIRSAFGPLTFDAKTGVDTWTPALTIDDITGNVGIGTTDPLYKLVVVEGAADTYAAQFDINSTTNAGISLRNVDTTANSLSTFRFNFSGDNGARLQGADILVGKEQLWLTSDNATKDAYMAFQVALDGSNTEAMRITSAGKVGIGTTSPSQMLQVENYMRVGATDTAAGLFFSGNAVDYIRYGDNSSTNLDIAARNSLNMIIDRNANGTADTFNVYSESTSGTLAFRVNETGDIFGGNFTTAGTERLCWDGTGGSWIRDCAGTPGDYAEQYGSLDPTLEAGDIVITDSLQNAYEVVDDAGLKGSKAWVLKATSPSSHNLLGIVSTQPNEVIGQNFSDIDHPVPIALNGRVPVKISPISQVIKIGDPITSSSDPGKGVKATSSGKIVGTALENWDPTNPKDTILVFVNNTYYNPELILSDSGDLTLNGDPIGGYSVTTTDGTIIDRVAGLASATIAKITAGLIQTKELEADKITTDYLASSNEEIVVATSASILGNLIVEQNLEVVGQTKLGQLVATDASISGSLVADSVRADSARLDYIESKLANLENASVSGTLYANNIEANSINAHLISGLKEKLTDQITETLSQPSLLAALFDNQTQQTDEYLNQLNQEIGNGPATASANLATIEQSGEDLTMIADSIFVNQYFEVNGITISNQSISYQPEGIEDFTFSIQPAGTGKLSLLAGLMELDHRGFVTIAGDLKVAGVLEVGDDLKVKDTLLTNLIGADRPGENIRVQLASNSASLDNPELTVQKSNFEFIDENQTPVATFSSAGDLALTGSLRLGQKLAIASDNAGQATLPANNTEIIIPSDQVEANSMIYVTPINSTNNQVLYVKNKTIDDPSTTANEASFSVAVDFALGQDVKFNWWIVQLD